MRPLVARSDLRFPMSTRTLILGVVIAALAVTVQAASALGAVVTSADGIVAHRLQPAEMKPDHGDPAQPSERPDGGVQRATDFSHEGNSTSGTSGSLGASPFNATAATPNSIAEILRP